MTEQERGAAVIQETIRIMREEHIGWSKAMALAADAIEPADEDEMCEDDGL